MSGRQAKIITEKMLRRMLAYVGGSPTTDRDRAIILLSIRAGLRAAEIAGLEWPMVLDAEGKVARTISLENRIAKRRSGRRIPMHHDLRQALIRLHRSDDIDGPVIRSARGGPMRANSIVNWFIELYNELGFEGCSSHSGRRTFITAAARNVYKAGGSLRDVQILAGHRSIALTQTYIEGDTDAQRRLVSLMRN